MIEALGTIARSGTTRFHGADRGCEGRRGRAADRPVRRRVLLGVHGGRAGRGASRAGPARTKRWRWSSDGQGSFTIAPPRPRGGARARHARHAASDGGRQGLRRARRRSSASSRRSPATCRCRSSSRSPATEPSRNRRRQRAMAQAQVGGQRRRNTPTSTQRRRPIRRAGADDALPRGGPARIYGARCSCRSRKPVRPVRSRARRAASSSMCAACSSPTRPQILPRYLRFVRGRRSIRADLPLNISREMIQESPVLDRDQEGRDQAAC